MFTAQDMQCAAILQAAAEAEFGLVIRTNDVYKARQTLYSARQKLNDATLADLQIRVSPDQAQSEIWIIRRHKAMTFNIGEESTVAQNH